MTPGAGTGRPRTTSSVLQAPDSRRTARPSACRCPSHTASA